MPDAERRTLIIESTQNQYVKRLRALATPKGRREHGEFLVEGLRAGSLDAALRSGGGTLVGYLLSMVVEFGLGASIITLFLITVL